MERQAYPTDLTEAEWEILGPLIPPAKPGGRPRRVDIREVLNALVYVLRSGCAWRYVPHDFGIPWPTVHYYMRRWRDDGTLEAINSNLRGQVRKEAGKEATPSAAIVDSQSVKTTEKGGPAAMTRASKSRAASATCL